MFRYKMSIYKLRYPSPVSFKERTISYLVSVCQIHPIYLRKSNRFTVSPCPPSRIHFLACHSTRWSTLIGNPINCGEAIRGIVVPTSSSNTGCKLSTVNALNPRYGGLVYNSRVRIVDMVHSQLDEDFLIRVKYERFKLNDFTLIFCPGWNVVEGVSSFLKRKTYK